MVKVLRFFVWLSVLVIPQMAQADFVIFLMNGSEIEAEQYQEIGDQIQYPRFGGQIRVRKSEVIAILDRETFYVQIFYTGLTPQQLETVRKLAEEARKAREAAQAEEAAREEESIRRYEAILREKAERRRREQRQADQRIETCLTAERKHLRRLKTLEQKAFYCQSLIELEKAGGPRLPW